MGTKQNNSGQYLSNWVITASWTDPVSGPQTRTATTDVNGQYVFNNLTPGLLYTIAEVNQPGWTSLIPSSWTMYVNPGTACAFAPFVNQPPAVSPTPTNTPISPVAICGNVYNDANANGAIDFGESKVTGVFISLLDNLGNPVTAIQTDGTGHYCFNNLTAGTYAVTEAVPTGYNATNAIPSAGGTKVSNIRISVVAATPGTTYQPNDFLITQPPTPTPTPTSTNTPVVSPTPTNTPVLGRLCSLVWFDQNGNTVRDGEPLLTNAIITMRDPSNNVIGTRLTNGTEPYCAR